MKLKHIGDILLAGSASDLSELGIDLSELGINLSVLFTTSPS
jgi:hypothetical protein